MSTAPDMVEVALGLGSNVGDKAGHIRAAAAALAGEGLLRESRLSPLYRTAPWGKRDQDWFVNACVVGLTALAPHDLLACVKGMEERLGRVAGERWGPRVIDIDILLYGAVRLRSPGLTIPHKDLAARAFVLVPLAQLWPDRLVEGRTISALAAALADDGVRPLPSA